MLTSIENVLAKDAIDRRRRDLERADWQDGQASAGSVSSSVKNNQQLAEDDETALALSRQVLAAIGAHPTFVSAALPHKVYPPKFNRYADGGTYGTHVDSAVMRPRHGPDIVRSDLSATLFLTDPDDYDGGELVIETQFGAQGVKLPAGDMVLYPSSSLHHVAPVTRGARVSSFFWIQSMVRETEQRALLFDFDQTIQALHGDLAPTDPRLVAMTGLYHNLLRQWTHV